MTNIVGVCKNFLVNVIARPLRLLRGNLKSLSAWNDENILYPQIPLSSPLRKGRGSLSTPKNTK